MNAQNVVSYTAHVSPAVVYTVRDTLRAICTVLVEGKSALGPTHNGPSASSKAELVERAKVVEVLRGIKKDPDDYHWRQDYIELINQILDKAVARIQRLPTAQ